MTADAAKRFAGLKSRPTPHGLNAIAVLIEKLEIDGRSRGNFKIRGTVFFDGNLAENVFHVPRAVADRRRRADHRRACRSVILVTADASDTELERDDAQRLDCPAFNPLKPRSFVDVLDVVFARLLVQIDLRRTRRRNLAFLKRNRLSATNRGIKGQKLAFAVEVKPVQAERNIVLPRAALGKIRAE